MRFEINSFTNLIFCSKDYHRPKIINKWISLILYQLGFTIVLIIYFGLCLWGYLSTVDHFSPRFPRPNRNQALMFRPLPENPYSTLIHFKHGMSGDWKNLKSSILDFMKPYSGFGKFVGPSETCKWSDRLNKIKRCHVAVRKWFDDDLDTGCTKPEAFGYIRGKPCVALKMNRIYGWEPEPYYNVTEVMQSEVIPYDVKENINATWQKHCKGNETQCDRLRMVWLSCHGATAADEEYLGPMRYTPTQGFPAKFFPYYNQQLYLSPVVWVQFHNIYPGVLITIECKLWAKNIQHDPKNPMVGGVRLELLMD